MTTKLVIKRRSDPQNAPPLDEINFTAPIVTIGSDTGATICLDDSSVAAEQAVIISEGAQLLLMNRGAGTSLNNETLPREALRPLVEGDCLYIGDYAISVIASAANVPANTNVQTGVPTSVPTDMAGLQSSQHSGQPPRC